MYIIALTHPHQLEALKGIIDRYTRAGMASEELPVVADVYVAVMNARELPEDVHLGKAKLASFGPEGIALELEHEVQPPHRIPESPVANK